MSTARFLVGDTFDRMAELEDGSVDLILTSPPFLALRSYLPADHPDKGKEIGSETSPAAFVDVLMRLTREWRRLLAPHGSLCVELGDTYSGNSQTGWARTGAAASNRYRKNGGAPGTLAKRCDGWPLAKSLSMIPELYRIALAYGHNPLNPDHHIEPWRIRNVIRWCRPNPPVGALGDKFRPATTEMVVACVSASRYFDLDAVREPGNRTEERHHGVTAENHPAGAPPLDWWEIPISPYKGAHYATFPPALCVKPIKAMCPERVCRTCGKPSERITGEPEYVPSATNRGGSTMAESERTAARVNQWVGPNGARASVIRTAPTLGWTDCGHDNYRPGLVLDPFAGTGTTLMVATGHSRDAIGIDIDERNHTHTQQRCGMFLTDETMNPPAPVMVAPEDRL